MAMFIKIIIILLSAILATAMLFIAIVHFAIKRYTQINILRLLYNVIRNKLSSIDVNTAPIKQTYSFDIYKIHKDCNIDNIEFIQKQLDHRLAYIHGNGKHIINNIISNKKNIIMLVGANNSGKTTCCFKIHKLFPALQSIICTADYI